MKEKRNLLIFTSLIIVSILLMFTQSCKKRDIECTDANTTTINNNDTIYARPCTQVVVKHPCTFIYNETLKSEINYGKPLVSASYAHVFSDFLGDNCVKGQIPNSLPYEDFYLENLSDRNFTVTCTLDAITRFVVKLKAKEKKLVSKKFINNPTIYERFSLIDIKYE